MLKTAIVRISQLFVGGLFIFSGLVKMNDPVGFSFKLEEYFSEEVLNMPIFEPFALPISILLVAVEVLLGLALLLGLWKRMVLILLSAMIGFFTFLTFLIILSAVRSDPSMRSARRCATAPYMFESSALEVSTPLFAAILCATVG